VPLSLNCSLLVGKYQHTSTCGLAASSDTYIHARAPWLERLLVAMCHHDGCCCRGLQVRTFRLRLSVTNVKWSEPSRKPLQPETGCFAACVGQLLGAQLIAARLT
jgi:hypothetical protein